MIGPAPPCAPPRGFSFAPGPTCTPPRDFNIGPGPTCNPPSDFNIGPGPTFDPPSDFNIGPGPTFDPPSDFNIGPEPTYNPPRPLIRTTFAPTRRTHSRPRPFIVHTQRDIDDASRWKIRRPNRQRRDPAVGTSMRRARSRGHGCAGRLGEFRIGD